MNKSKSLKEVIVMLEKDIEESQRTFDSGNFGARERQINKLKAEWGGNDRFEG